MSKAEVDPKECPDDKQSGMAIDAEPIARRQADGVNQAKMHQAKNNMAEINLAKIGTATLPCR
ncbi:MAG: hypothetical protein QM579_00315 [Desulfovibrio sp.]|uniref:hypothetical protein n=1 Tax=Desulfovibrio sp. TaxID=885 RepID=UPI0039E3AC95